MTKRRTFLLLGTLFGATGVSACSALLGDFSDGPAAAQDGGPPTGDSSLPTGDGTTPNDGTAPGDSPTTGDGPQVGDASDAGGDAADAAEAAAPLPTLTCLEPAGQDRIALGTIAKNPNGNGTPIQLFKLAAGSAAQFRAVVPENQSGGGQLFHVYSFDQSGAPSDTPVPMGTSESQVLKVHQYTGGLAALVQRQPADAGTGEEVDIYTLADSATTWSTPLTVVSSVGGVFPSCGNNYEGDFVALNPATNDYLAEVTFQTCGSSPSTFYGVARTAGGAPPVAWNNPPQAFEGDAGPDGGDAGVQKYDLGGVAVTSGSQIFAFTNPSSGNGGGPDTGFGSALYTSSLSAIGTETARELALPDQTYFMQMYGLQPLSNGNIGLIALEASFSTSAIEPLLYVGEVSPAKMATLVPSNDLVLTSFSSVNDAPLNGASIHWESGGTPATDNVLALGSDLTTGLGLNFTWWDATGTVRAENVGTTGALFPTLPIVGGDATFTTGPFTTLADFEVVFGEIQADASDQVNVWATQVNCSQ